MTTEASNCTFLFSMLMLLEDIFGILFFVFTPILLYIMLSAKCNCYSACWKITLSSQDIPRRECNMTFAPMSIWWCQGDKTNIMKKNKNNKNVQEFSVHAGEITVSKRDYWGSENSRKGLSAITWAWWRDYIVMDRMKLKSMPCWGKKGYCKKLYAGEWGESISDYA